MREDEAKSLSTKLGTWIGLALLAWLILLGVIAGTVQFVRWLW